VIEAGKMNLLLISCLLLFVIYFSIVGLLVYYFFRARDTWNIFFNEIYQDFEFLVSGCSKHNTIGFFIPGFISSRSSDDAECNQCTREDKIRDANLYNVNTLYNIYTLFKTLDANVMEDEKISSKCKMFQLLLEYIIRNYKELCDGDYALYERLQMIYLDKDETKDISLRLNKSLIGIEMIPILEEYSGILEKLDIICQEINIDMVHETFMIAFYQDFKIFVINAKNYISEFLGFKTSDF